MSDPGLPRDAGAEPIIERAYAKINLCLFLGPVRADGRHELVTLFDSVSLCDELRVRVAASSADQVVCPGVSGPNLVTEALAALRARGWRAPPVRVAIVKRIPVAAGMGGGSADAAALLRLAGRLAPVAGATISEIATELGADVPGRLDPGPSLGTGAGEVVTPVTIRDRPAVLVLPQPFGLSTAEVYRAADRLGLPRTASALAGLRAEVETALDGGAPLPDRLLVNDLEPAALALRPEIAEALEAARAAGADRTMVCGSGPTVIGVFRGAAGLGFASAAVERLATRFPGAAAVRPR